MIYEDENELTKGMSTIMKQRQTIDRWKMVNSKKEKGGGAKGDISLCVRRQFCVVVGQKRGQDIHLLQQGGFV